LQSNAVDAMRKAKDSLMQASHKLAETIYKDAASKASPNTGGAKTGAAAGSASGSTGNGGSNAASSEAVDAEVVDEGKK